VIAFFVLEICTTRLVISYPFSLLSFDFFACGISPTCFLFNKGGVQNSKPQAQNKLQAQSSKELGKIYIIEFWNLGFTPLIFFYLTG